MDARHSYDAVADDYAAEIGDELRHKPLDRALLGLVAELATGTVVLDIGCGPGHVAAHLASLGARTVGVDLSPRMCAIAAQRRSVPATAADMTALALRSGTAGAIVCLYAVIHLGQDARAAAYREFRRVLAPGGHALIAFHTGDADSPTGTARTLTDWWGHDVDLTFRFLDPDEESAALSEADLEPVARLDRAPHPGREHQSRRSYLLVRRSLNPPHDGVPDHHGVSAAAGRPG